MERFSLGIIIPAYNEESSISAVVKAAMHYGQVIVVSDGSTDQTVQCAQSNGAIVVEHEFSKGYDAALETGFSKAAELQFTHVITLDADGQHDPKLIPLFVENLKSYDLVLGRRSKKQRVCECLFAFYTSLCWRVHDPLCGMKGYKMSLYHKRGYFDSCKSVGSELMIFALKQQIKFIEVPVTILPRSDVSRFGGIFRANYKLLRALFLMISKYRF